MNAATLNGAYAMGLGEELGSITPGKKANLIFTKPIPSIARPQETVDALGRSATVTIGGRHDASVIPRIIPVCEAMVAIVLADHLLRQRAITV